MCFSYLLKVKHSGAGSRIQQVKVLVEKSGDLSLIPGTFVERKNRLGKFASDLHRQSVTNMCPYMYRGGEGGEKEGERAGGVLCLKRG